MKPSDICLALLVVLIWGINFVVIKLGLQGLPPILFPLHVVLLELVVDPVCSLVFEGEPSERHAMERPPRPRGEALFGSTQVLLGLLQGGVVLASVIGIYSWALNAGLGEAQSRAAAFVALIIGNLALAFADSAEPGTSFFDKRRLAFWLIGAAAALIIASVLYIPALAGILRITPPEISWLLIAGGIAVMSGGWFGLARRLLWGVR